MHNLQKLIYQRLRKWLCLLAAVMLMAPCITGGADAFKPWPADAPKPVLHVNCVSAKGVVMVRVMLSGHVTGWFPVQCDVGEAL